MGKTSSAVKNRYNQKAYDRCVVNIPKGMRDRLKEKCAAEGISMNSIFLKAAKDYLGED
ncbi:MAG: Arc family DNA-binding protein [Mogibacterium sp.]|nr:Arc family DNA-binding protein [Mogibacterium sp.]